MTKTYVVLKRFLVSIASFYAEKGDILVHDTSNNNSLTVYREGKLMKTTTGSLLALSALKSHGNIDLVASPTDVTPIADPDPLKPTFIEKAIIQADIIKLEAEEIIGDAITDTKGAIDAIESKVDGIDAEVLKITPDFTADVKKIVTDVETKPKEIIAATEKKAEEVIPAVEKPVTEVKAETEKVVTEGEADVKAVATDVKADIEKVVPEAEKAKTDAEGLGKKVIEEVEMIAEDIATTAENLGKAVTSRAKKAAAKV
jgi:hypothetical protein